MTLAVAIKGSEGIVLAIDSRVTISFTPKGTNLVIPTTYDNATKLLRVESQKFVGAVTYGTAVLNIIEPRTVHSFLPEFEATLSTGSRLSVQQFAVQLGQFFLRQWNASPHPQGTEGIYFIIGGYNDNEPYGRLYLVGVPNSPEPKELHANQFGAQWGGGKGGRQSVKRCSNSLATFAASRLH